MATVQDLEGHLGKHIRDICGNAYADDGDNHCAHFVAHVMKLRFGATCHSLGNGKAPGASVRVHEVFGRCWKVGAWESRAPTLPTCLVFMTNAGNVQLGTGVMSNVPRKHMGIYLAGVVWHYSNTLRKVVKQSPGDFSTHYAAPDNAMFYGLIA